MTIEAVNVILEKAWELKSQALIFTDKLFTICPKDYDWKTYDTLKVLCIYDKTSKTESYLDTDSIKKIVIKDE
jgi:hypothetical protein